MNVNPLGPLSYKLARIFCAVIFRTLLLSCFSVAPAKGFAADALQPFAEFSVKADIDIEDGEIEVTATFTLGPASNGIEPTKENITLQVKGGSANYFLMIPAGSFQPATNKGSVFRGTIAGVKLLAWVRLLQSGAFEFEIVTERANLNGMANPVAVSLTVGDDGGSRSVQARIE